MTPEEKQQRKLERMRKPVEKIPDSYGADQLLQYASAKMLKYGLETTIEGMKNRLEKVIIETIEDYQDYLQGKEPKKSKKKTEKKNEKKTIDAKKLNQNALL